jgi:hypothetical protein
MQLQASLKNLGIRASKGVLYPMGIRGNFELHNLIGQTFGLLTAVGRAPNNEFGMVHWWLQCTCGEVVKRRANSLRAGKFFTCGKPKYRFWEKIDKNGPMLPGMETNCWIWTRAIKDTGYGVLKVPGEKRNVLVHVFSYDMHFDDRAGRWVLHHCDNRPCVRPEHIFPGTHRDNMRDMAEKGRAATVGKVYLSANEKQKMINVYGQGGLSHSDLVTKFGVSIATGRRTLRRASNKE